MAGRASGQAGAGAKPSGLPRSRRRRRGERRAVTRARARFGLTPRVSRDTCDGFLRHRGGTGDQGRTGLASSEGGILRRRMRWSAACSHLRISARDPHLTRGHGLLPELLGVHLLRRPTRAPPSLAAGVWRCSADGGHVEQGGGGVPAVVQPDEPDPPRRVVELGSLRPVGCLLVGHSDAWDGGIVTDAATGGPPSTRPCHRPPDDRDRLAFLAEVSDAMIRSLDTGETADRLARLAVPRLADWATVTVLGDDGGAPRTARAHRDPGRLEDLDTYLAGRLSGARDRPALMMRLLSGQPVQLTSVDPELSGPALPSEPVRAAWERLAASSVVLLPLIVHGETIGALSRSSGGSGRTFVG